VIKQGVEMHFSSRQTILASSTLTLALVSDAVLYLLLPIYFETFLLTFVWVGILLSANRFLRIALNPLVLAVYSFLGVRQSALLAVVFACIGCALFLYPFSPWLLLIARLLWGFAYALLRLSCLYCATKEPAYNLKNMGWYAAVQELGPLLVLLVAPWINHWYSVDSIILISLILCICAFIPAFMLNTDVSEQSTIKKSWLPAMNYQHSLTFMFCLLFDAIWVVIIAPLLIRSGMDQEQALLATAILLVLKRGFNLLLGLVVVKYHDFKHARRLLNQSLWIMIVAAVFLIQVQATMILLGSLLGIFGHGLFMILMPKVLVDAQGGVLERKASLNDFTIWRDIAAALGALLAGFLLQVNGVNIFILSCAVMMAVVIGYMNVWQRKSMIK
jgi:MFS family permease